MAAATASTASSTTAADHLTQVAVDGLVSISPLKKMAMDANEHTPIRIGQVVSTDLLFDAGHGRTVTLRDVPVFLVGAFNQIRLNGMETDGLFRREGNATRLKMIWGPYHGHVGIPAVCTIPDICSMIKRFFRECQKPLFADLQPQLLQFAVSIEHEPTRLKSILQLCHVLPSAHLGTLGYLMRQLKFLADNCERHQMTAENLATVFAPTLFRDEPTSTKKTKKGSQDDLLAAVRVDTAVKIAVVKLLIENADHIGMMSNMEPTPPAKKHSVDSGKDAATTDRQQPASKATPFRSGTSRSNSVKAASRSVNNSKGRLRKDGKADRRFARKDDDEKLESGRNSKQRRSSSTVRDVFNSIASKLRSKSPPPSPPLGSVTKRITATVSNEDFTVSKLRQALDDTSDVPLQRSEDVPDLRTKLVFEYDSPRSDSSDQQSPHRSTMTSALVSPPSLHRPATIQRVQSTKSDNRSQMMMPNVFEWSSPAMEPTTVSSKAVSPPFTPAACIAAIGYRQQLATVVDNSPATAVAVTPAGGRALRSRSSINAEDAKKAVNLPTDVAKILPADQCHSLLSGEYLAANKHLPNRLRRHTAPIRNNPLRRNQPNTVNSGLKNPKDRRLTATLTIDATTEPQSGGGMKRRSRSVERFAPNPSPTFSSADEDDQMTMTMATDDSTLDSAALLEQKGLEARQRRAKRVKRKEATTAAAATMTSPMVTSPVKTMVTSPVKTMVTSPVKTMVTSPVKTMVTSPVKTMVTTIIVNAEDSLSDHMTSVLKDHNEMVSPTIASNEEKEIVPIPIIPDPSLPSVVVNGPSGDAHLGMAPPSAPCGVNGIDDEFADSDKRREQLLAASDHRDLRSGPVHMAVDCTRPSVAFIQKHRRGIVQQRVSQFVNIAESNSAEHVIADGAITRARRSSTSATGGSRMDSDGFVKPAATPAPRACRSAVKTSAGMNNFAIRPSLPPKIVPKRLNAATSSPKSPLTGLRAPSNRFNNKSSPLREAPKSRLSPRNAPLTSRF